MATDQWINSAAHEQKPGMYSDMSGGALIACPPGTPEAEAKERAAAIRNNRWLANHHGCEGLCDRPEHARDVAAGVEVLEALGLIPYRYAPGDADTIRCRRCQKRKPPAAFSPVSKRQSTGRATYCKACGTADRITPKENA